MIEFPGYQTIAEPKLTFEAFSKAQDIHPLKGLKSFGPYSSKICPIDKIRVAANLFGGQGTINVPSWSPDSKLFAFVSYQLIP